MRAFALGPALAPTSTSAFASTPAVSTTAVFTSGNRRDSRGR